MKSTNDITLSESALKRIGEIRQKPENATKFLRIGVSGGGCSGFQYIFNLDDKINEDDLAILALDSKIIALTDESSMPLLSGCEVDFVQDLGSSYFKVKNPNAKASCGCGSSFSV